MRRSPAKILLVVCKKQDSQTQSWLRSIPASWASGASSEEGGPARLSAPAGSDPKTNLGDGRRGRALGSMGGRGEEGVGGRVGSRSG